MIREIVNGIWKIALGATIIYACAQTYYFFKDTHESYVRANSQTPVVDTMGDTAKIFAHGLNRTGKIVSKSGDVVYKSAEYSRPYLESLEKMVKDRETVEDENTVEDRIVEDGKEKQQE
jgi:hypothetical protein